MRQANDAANVGSSINLLSDHGVLEFQTTSGTYRGSLPNLYTMLMADEVDALPALRPHQKQAFHCFLAQTGAMAMIAADETKPPGQEQRWRELLRGLTPSFSHDEPWCLVVDDLSKPAFMQPPVPEGSWAPLKEREETPDGLDILVASRNHDLKAGRIARATPEHWLYSLITLQTCEGFLGRGNYGISRMNGGFASRPFIGAAPVRGGWGTHVRRDIEALVARRSQLVENSSIHAPKGGVGLLWLVPWDGRGALSPSKLDPYYVEICRRVRLRRENDRIIAMRGSTEGMRVDQPKIKHAGKEHTMPTGDPWAPVEIEGLKPLTVDGAGFPYRRIVNLLDDGKFSFAPLQQLDDREGTDAMQLVFVATARGQGETQGHHERRILVPPRAVPFFMRSRGSPRLATLARQHVQDVSDTSSKALRPALFTLFQSAPAKIDYGDPKSKAKAELHLTAFERLVDEDFFERLFDELVEELGSDSALRKRTEWIKSLRERARTVLAAAAAGSPLSHVRRYRARAAAERVLIGTLHRHFKDVFSEAA